MISEAPTKARSSQASSKRPHRHSVVTCRERGKMFPAWAARGCNSAAGPLQPRK
jgi:hypothetical protein